LAWYPYLFAAGAALLLFVFFYSRTDRGALMLERVFRRMPLLGRLWLLLNQNIFAGTMRMLLTGGIPVPQSLAIMAGAVPSRAFAAELTRTHQELVSGSSLQDALETHTRLDDMVGEMVRVGEATGTLSDMFGYLAELGEEQAEDLLELISNLIAPIILLVVGVIIAILVLAMYLPMFGSYDAIMG
jgi:type IV pilus assembly protein PilC